MRTLRSAFDGLYNLFGAVFQVVGGDHVEPGIRDDFLALFDIGAFQTHNQRYLQAHLFDGGNDAFGDHVAAHDATKDVDQNAFDLRIGGDDLERLGHFFLGGATAHVKEVGRFSAIELDDVHRGHSKARAVHHAADLAIQSDVVQIVFGGFEFLGVFLGRVAQLGDVGMTVDRVGVEPHLGVEAFQVALVGQDQRVDFQHLHVLFEEQRIEDAHQLDALLDLRALEAQHEGDPAAIDRLVAGGGINREAENLVGGAFGDFLDIHAAFGRGGERDARGLTIDQKREVEFLFDAGAVFDINPVHLLAGRAGLLGDEGAAQHALGFLGGFLDRLGEADTAGFACAGFLEAALAAATCVDLRLDHPEGAVEFRSEEHTSE